MQQLDSSAANTSSAKRIRLNLHYVSCIERSHTRVEHPLKGMSQGAKLLLVGWCEDAPEMLRSAGVGVRDTGIDAS